MIVIRGGNEKVRDITGEPEDAICRGMKRSLINSGRNGADVGNMRPDVPALLPKRMGRMDC